MSQKSFTVLTASVQLAIPSDLTQAQTLELIKRLLTAAGTPFASYTIIVKPLKREVTYL